MSRPSCGATRATGAGPSSRSASSEIVYRPIPDNARRITALLSGDVDFVQDVPVDEIQRLHGSPGIRLNTGPENRSIFLGLNVGARELASSDVKGRNPFADRRVREAVGMAIDRDAMRRTVMRGQSVPAGVIVPPFSNGYSQGARPAVRRSTPPRRAPSFATQASRDGFSVTLHCTNDRYVNDEGLCRVIAEMLGRIGVRANAVAQPAIRHFAQVRRAELDLYLLGWGVTTFDSEYIFSHLYYTNTGSARGLERHQVLRSRQSTRRSGRSAPRSMRARRSAGMAMLWQKLKAEDDLRSAPQPDDHARHARRLRHPDRRLEPAQDEIRRRSNADL